MESIYIDSKHIHNYKNIYYNNVEYLYIIILQANMYLTLFSTKHTIVHSFHLFHSFRLSVCHIVFFLLFKSARI